MTASRAELDELVDRVGRGDQAALDRLVREIGDDVYGLALRMLWHPQDAEDATQEILIKVVTRLSTFRRDASLRTWVYRVAANHLLDVRRSRLERQGWSFDAHAADLADGLSDAAPADDPEQAVLAEEVKLGCTLAMLTCLNRPHRLAYILGDVFGVGSDDGAYITDATAAAYRQRLSRARRRIRNFLAGQCGIANPDNPCRCAGRVDRAVAMGRVDPENLLFAGHQARARQAVDEMQNLHDVAALMRSHPDYAAPQRLKDAIADLVKSERLTLLRD